MPPPHGLSPLPTADPAAVFPISPRKPPPPLPPALIAASLATTTTSTLYRSPLARPCCSGRLPPAVRSVQPQPRDHLSAIAESGAVLCLSFIPTATPVANVPPSLAATAASNRALCHCRSLLTLLAPQPVAAATAGHLCSSLPLPPATICFLLCYQSQPLHPVVAATHIATTALSSTATTALLTVASYPAVVASHCNTQPSSVAVLPKRRRLLPSAPSPTPSTAICI
ncbi:hypothetical protein B296_00031565 [Ensete ventricosum]|uniref:Uncharacterized protein n=1 Tax=Ensete ventricosum TaxID=4639 RepID=A0A426YJF7_ENSVE|nr:hypothetical protein B296_00031565 [Ensete ventricosum]